MTAERAALAGSAFLVHPKQLPFCEKLSLSFLISGLRALLRAEAGGLGERTVHLLIMPAYQASGLRSMKEFEHAFRPLQCFGLNASNILVRAVMQHPELYDDDEPVCNARSDGCNASIVLLICLQSTAMQDELAAAHAALKTRIRVQLGHR